MAQRSQIWSNADGAGTMGGGRALAENSRERERDREKIYRERQRVDFLRHDY